MQATYIQGIYKNSKDINDFTTALIANGCHSMSIDFIYKLCKQGDFTTAALVATENGAY